MIRPPTPTPDGWNPGFKLFLLVAVLVATVGTPVVATVGGAPTAQTADLVIDQPHYVDSDVRRQTDNGTVVYEARGAELELYPQNFATADVVNFGTTTGDASLAFDRRTGVFTFTAERAGTHSVYFVVKRTVLVDGQGNATAGNETSGTRTVKRQVRYEARIRVTGGLDLVHRSAGSLAAQETAAANWREFNSTIHERELVGAAGTERAIAEMVRWYELRKHPQEALAGGVVTYIIIGVTSTAILLWVIVLGWHSKVVNALRTRLRTEKAIKEEEGHAKDTIADLEAKQDRQAAQNTRWTELDGFDDLVASAFRDMFGETLHDGAVEWAGAVLPRTLVADRLKAMGHDGWVAVVDDRAEADGDDGPGTIEAAHLAQESDVAADADIVRLADADDATVADIRDALESWDCEPLCGFDLTRADVDTSSAETSFDSVDLDTIIDRLEVDMRYFDDPEEFGEYLREFVTSVKQSPECDSEGRPDDIRGVMSHFLKIAQRLDGRHNYPVFGWYREAIEKALLDFSPEQRAQQKIDEIEVGVGGD